MVLERLFLLLVEAAVETVPEEIQNHPAVLKDAGRRGKKPSQVLLDRSYHHWAMKTLKDGQKRGRPDIVHFSLLEALGSPLNMKGLLETYVVTRDGLIVHVNPAVRLPRVYERFKGVFEQLFEKGVIVSDSGQVLMRLEKGSLEELVERLKPTTRILLSEKADPRTASSLQTLLKTPRPLVMVGCFPHGDFSPETERLAEMHVALYEKPLEAWVAVSRVLCTAEQVVG
ncbi:MAG: 16S rRNA methyltransferase [Candidatus Caldarchaeum sp.]